MGREKEWGEGGLGWGGVSWRGGGGGGEVGMRDRGGWRRKGGGGGGLPYHSDLRQHPLEKYTPLWLDLCGANVDAQCHIAQKDNKQPLQDSDRRAYRADGAKGSGRKETGQAEGMASLLPPQSLSRPRLSPLAPWPARLCPSPREPGPGYTSQVGSESDLGRAGLAPGRPACCPCRAGSGSACASWNVSLSVSGSAVGLDPAVSWDSTLKYG